MILLSKGWAVSEKSRRYSIVLKYLGITKYPVLSLTLKLSICSYSMHVKMCLTSHNLSGSTYLLTLSMYKKYSVFLKNIYIATYKLQKNVINCYYGILLLAIMEKVLISYLGIPVLPVPYYRYIAQHYVKPINFLTL